MTHIKAARKDGGDKRKSALIITGFMTDHKSCYERNVSETELDHVIRHFVTTALISAGN